MRVFVDTHDTKRVYIAHPGSLGTILVILITGLLLAVFFVLLLGAMLIWMSAYRRILDDDDATSNSPLRNGRVSGREWPPA